MIQPKRSSNSTSLFREAQYSVVVLDEENKENFFKKQIQTVVSNRKNPNVFFTGAKTLKTQFLAALSQLGEVKTANIWARKLLIDLTAIQQLQQIIESTLRQKKIYGVIEIHLQDPEVNSSHIQFVGVRAEEAELEIAHIVVKLGYEQDIQSAISKKIPVVMEAESQPQDFIDEKPVDSEDEGRESVSFESLELLKNRLSMELNQKFTMATEKFYQERRSSLRKLDNATLKRFYKKP